MEISQGKPNSGLALIAEVIPRRSSLRWILYLGAGLIALVAGTAFSTRIAAAQEELPQINPGERKIPQKKDLGPRALALLKLTPDGKTSLLPITILINDKFWDATAYKADPVPMALESGTVYEAERTGTSLGLFTVGSALHSKAPNVLSPWLATGAWAPAGSEKADTDHTAAIVPVGIDTSDQPPRLTRDPSREHLPEQTSAANTKPASGPAPSSGSGSGDEPPRLTKPADSSPSQPAAAPAPSTGASPAGSPSTTGSAPPSNPSPRSTTSPAGSKPAAKPEEGPKPPASDSGATDANRPRLRRGRPTTSVPDEEVPGYGKPGSEPAVSAGKAAAPADQGQFQLIPAISDAKGPEPHSFAFEWLKGEEDERRQQVTALAKEQLRAYLQAQAKARISPVAEEKKTSRHAPAPKPREPILDNVQMNTYDLWLSNQPVIVFSAEAHLPPPASGQASPESEMKYSILLVAYPDIYNNLHKLYVGVTDKYHLDLTPRLQLVDAVDADGDGRGELLFRETTDAGGGWVIYRATADKLWKMFDSLNPE